MASFSVFGWLRRAAAQAVVDGVRDGLAAVADDGDGGAPVPDLGELRKRLASAVEPRALPAASVPTPAEVTAAAEGEAVKPARKK